MDSSVIVGLMAVAVSGGGMILVTTNRIRADMQSMRSELSRSIEKLSSRVGSLETRMGSLETRIGSLETRIDSLETRVGSVERGLGRLEGLLEGRGLLQPREQADLVAEPRTAPAGD